MTPPQNRASRRPAVALAGGVLFSFAAAAPGAWHPPGEWYASLAKPAWTPPGWIFGPVWSTLYATMGVAAWRVWRRRGWTAPGRPLGWFLAQWAFNAAWTPLFFGLHRPGWALLDILALLVAIAGTGLAFRRVSWVAAGLMIPYLGWVAFAAALNGAIWRMNR